VAFHSLAVVQSAPVLASSFVVHVAAAALWTGSVLYVAYAVLPTARAGDLGAAAFAAALDGLLQVTRWTGVALPVTGAYQLWVLYPLDGLLATTRGQLVAAMAALWGVTNGVVELGAYRVRTRDGSDRLGLARHFVRPLDAAELVGADPAALAATARPYVLAAAGLAVLLLVDAGLLAAGVAPP